MKISNFKKGKKVKLIPWKKAKKICKYDKDWDCIHVPMGDDSDTISWDYDEYEELKNKIYIMERLDEDYDIEMENDYVFQPILLMNASLSISFKSILSNN